MITSLFRVVSISTKPNSFGLHGHILVNRDGLAYEVGRSIGPWNDAWLKGSDISIPMDQTARGQEPNWTGMGIEIPRKLDKPPVSVLAEIFGAQP
jgi:hypothetical protein